MKYLVLVLGALVGGAIVTGMLTFVHRKTECQYEHYGFPAVSRIVPVKSEPTILPSGLALGCTDYIGAPAGAIGFVIDTLFWSGISFLATLVLIWTRKGRNKSFQQKR